MERRKFLANLVCLTVGASIAPKVLGELKLSEPPVDPRIFQYPLTYKEAYKEGYKPPADFIIGHVIELNNNEVTILPVNKTEEFPALKKGDSLIIISNFFSEGKTDTPPRYSHQEENSEHFIIIINEDIPKMGAGNKIVFLINNPSQIRLCDSILFLK